MNDSNATEPHPEPASAASEAPDAAPNRDAIVRWFQKAERQHPKPLIGTELEAFAVHRSDDGNVIETPNYERDIGPLLKFMIEQFGWQSGPDKGDGGETVQLVRDRASITLEPGGQVELSGAPLSSGFETQAELLRHVDELRQASNALKLDFFVAGHHPFATRDDIHWMPKGRYAIMRNYLPTRGSRALDMMLRTCTVQVNLDYDNEAQCGQRLRLALSISPVLTAMFANSPYVEGQATGLVSNRSEVWTDVDAHRCGLIDFPFDSKGFGYGDYVDWALSVPMFFVKREGVYHPHHASFGEFMRDGFTDSGGRKHQASLSDWELHASTLFPEVRLKPFIEIRGCDANAIELSLALPAFARGLFYDEQSSQRAMTLTQLESAEARADLWQRARAQGLADPQIATWADELLNLADAGLKRQAATQTDGRSESELLDPLRQRVTNRQSASQYLLQRLGPQPGVSSEGKRQLVEAFPLSLG